jgi:hypothetical protein
MTENKTTRDCRDSGTVPALVRAEIERSEVEISSIFSRYLPGQCLHVCNGDSLRFWKLKRRIERLRRLFPTRRDSLAVMKLKAKNERRGVGVGCSRWLERIL